MSAERHTPSVSRAQAVAARGPWIHSPAVHAVLYSLLLIATPFILLRNYLVQAISVGSVSSIPIFGLELKLVPLVALIIAVLLLVFFRKRITKLTLLAVAVVIALDALAQQITDYYFGHNYYDLQQNWHYIAYGLYAFMIYRYLNGRGAPLHRMILITFFSAFGLSLTDELFQQYMSARVFDVGDIGKDVLGVYMGMVLVYFAGRQSRALLKDWRKIRHRKLRGYYRHPFTLLLLMFTLCFIFLSVGSLLTEAEYAPLVFALTIAFFALFIVIFHLSQFRPAAIALIAILVISLAAQGYFFLKYRGQNITHTRYGLTVYRGIPIPFFDFMIYQDGGFRLVDKKHFFNQRDRDFFFKRQPDIILIASGVDGRGGRGFPDPRHSFVFNPSTHRATQVIIQRNMDACKTFNRLKMEGKKVLFVVHNTC
jgi:hypothetical protein